MPTAWLLAGTFQPRPSSLGPLCPGLGAGVWSRGTSLPPEDVWVQRRQDSLSESSSPPCLVDGKSRFSCRGWIQLLKSRKTYTHTSHLSLETGPQLCPQDLPPSFFFFFREKAVPAFNSLQPRADHSHLLAWLCAAPCTVPRWESLLCCKCPFPTEIPSPHPSVILIFARLPPPPRPGSVWP